MNAGGRKWNSGNFTWARAVACKPRMLQPQSSFFYPTPKLAFISRKVYRFTLAVWVVFILRDFGGCGQTETRSWQNEWIVSLHILCQLWDSVTSWIGWRWVSLMQTQTWTRSGRVMARYTERGVETFDQRAALMVGGILCVIFIWPCWLPRRVTHLILHINHCARRV